MTIFKEWFVILNLVGLFSGTLFASEPFTYSLTPSTIQPGNHAVLRLSVPIEPQENEGSITVNDALLFESPELIVLEKTSERTDCCLTISYDLTGYKSKSYLLPPIEIKTHGNSFSTETKTLAIASLRPEEDNEIRESFGALTPPFPFRKWGKIVGLLLILTFLLVTLPKKLKLLYRKRPLYQTKKVPTIPTEDPLLWLKKQIHQLKLKHKQDPFNDLLIDEWSRIIRGYVGRVSAVPALTWTTRELKIGVSTSVPILKMIPSLESSDQFKFQTEMRTEDSVTLLIGKYIQETEKHLLLCGN
ncbi:MAG: hypothetical protein HQ462_11470 [Deltaproteobacteria bacterium]|nr:hypothetical protein [Deltaproteobacteria bacterium]